MSDTGEMWREVRQQGQVKRASNRKSSADILAEAGVPFERKNGGAHLVVDANGHVVDFGPGTGKWIERGSKRSGRGVMALIKAVTT